MEFISDLDIRILDFSQSMDVEINELFAAARDKMETQGLFSREAFFEAIDEVLEEFQNDGLITDDDNTPEVREQLRRKWAELDQDEDIGVKEKISKDDEELLDQYLKEE